MLSDSQKKKERAIDLLRERYAKQRCQVESVEPRLAEYYDGLCTNVGVELGDTNDWHNVSELLCAIKLLRLMQTYIIDSDMVADVVYMYEGSWEQDANGLWRHVRDGIKHPGNSGETHYRLQPFQVFILTSIFGLKCWVNTHNEAGSRELFPSEKIVDGEIWDCRRLCTEFTFYTPRKTAKTQLSAFIQFWFFMFGDHNAECYCAANASDQAKILFSRTKALIHQLDPKERRIRFTASQVNWKPGQFRQASLTALSAGGKTKDGLFAQLCSADEYGSAAYVNGSSDMGRLVSVIESSMGPRREPLTFITTTAGTITQGPFIDKLQGIEYGLDGELEMDWQSDGNGNGVLQDINDRHLAILFQPDEYERDTEYLLNSPCVRRKVNAMLGLTVQHSFYDDEVAKARNEGPEKLNDVIAKDFNVYVVGTTKEWIKPDEIRRLQIPMRIDDCTADKGWVVFMGNDFSKGDDLNGNGYLAVNTRTKEFFCDTDLWVSEKAVNASPIHELYFRWKETGWLTIMPGDTFDPAVVVNRVAQLTQKGVDIWRIGYDPYNAAIVINALSAYIVDMGREPKQHIMPVRQNFATYNGVVNEFDYMVHRCTPEGKPYPMVHFSENPMIPWQFGNCTLAVSGDGMENKKPVKRNPGSEACKVDSVQMFLSALWCYDVVDGGKVEE